MTSPRWTAAQQTAIETVGRNVLVTASAGTGKTAVLSRRCVRRICDRRNPVDVDRLLVMTFTDAAAEEMKTRIAAMLSDAWRAEPGRMHLRKQLLRLDAAYIGTIHSFCKRILHEHFYLLGLDPRFGILDPDQQSLIRLAAMDKAVDRAWKDSRFAGGLRQLFGGRNLRRTTHSFTDEILRLAGFIDSLPDRNEFYASAKMFSQDGEQSRSCLAKMESVYLSSQTGVCRQILLHARHLEQILARGQYLGDIIESLLGVMQECSGALKKNNVAECGRILRGLEFPRLNAPKKSLGLNKDDADQIRAPLYIVKEKLNKISSLCFLYPEYVESIAGPMENQTGTLLELLRMFDEEYTQAKRRLNTLDFADLEHRMLELLKHHPAVAEKLRQRFEYVFVDEYQDINRVQQNILDHISRGSNLFVVGDVKQSIYAFRQSSPEIFLEQLSRAGDVKAGGDIALRVDMQHNFRSRAEILNFVNTVFGAIMMPSIADMEYDCCAELISGIEYPPLLTGGPSAQKAVEFYLLDEESSDEESDSGDETENRELQEDDEDEKDGGQMQQTTSVQRQAAFIARRIRRMVGAESGKAEFQILDKSTGLMRDVQYRDIVIIMRALSHRAAEYVEMLRLAGVPVSSQSQCGYFAATEVTEFLSLLKVLDNPLQDIEFAGILRGPAFRFSDSELLEMRLYAGETGIKKATYYEIADVYARQGPDLQLRQKISAALSIVNEWRTQSRHKTLSELIWQILESTLMSAFFSAMPNGPQRRANLLKMHDRAVQFEAFAGSGQGHNLAAFVSFIEKMLDEEYDWAPAQPENSVENVVRIMSVHKSKGLEFPVVFLAELNRRFNMTGANSSCEIDSKILAVELTSPENGLKLPTPIQQLIRLDNRRRGMAEEMRILYVAMTRARDRLILTASQKSQSCLSYIQRLANMESLADWQLEDAKTHLEWILAGLCRFDTIRAILDPESAGPLYDELFLVNRIQKNELDSLSDQIRRQKQRREKPWHPLACGCDDLAAKKLFDAIKANLTWQYPYQPMTRLEAKFSVSALTHRDDEYFKPQTDTSFDLRPACLTADAGKSTDRAGALELGTAVHLIYEHIPLSEPADETSVRRVVKQLLEQDQLSPAMAEKIDPRAIAAFFDTDIGRLAAQMHKTIYREWPFTFALPAAELGINSLDESVIVQGVIDMLIQKPDGLVIVDFKTDNVSSEGIASRVQQYQTQLNLYAKAAAAILKTPVTSAWIYFLNPKILCPVDMNIPLL